MQRPSIFDQVSYLATQQYVDQFRNGLPTRRKKRPPVPNSAETTRPSSQDSFSTALEGLNSNAYADSDDGIIHNTAGAYEGIGPIIATPMGIVRPWPREGGEAGAAEASRPGQLPDGESGGQASAGGEETPRSAGTVTPTGDHPGLETGESRKSSEGDNAGLIISTPMGNVRPRRFGDRSKTGRNQNDASTLGQKPPVQNEKKQPEAGEESTAKASSNVAAGNEMGSEEREPPSGTHRRSPSGSPGYNTGNTNTGTATEGPPPKKPPSMNNTTAATTLPAPSYPPTTLTLLTESLSALTTFYTLLFNATPLLSTPTSTTLSLTPTLTVVLRTSASAG